MPRRASASLATVRRIAMSLPGVEEGLAYGTPTFRVRGRFLFRLREDGVTLAVKCGFDERDFRMQADPGSFFTTDHYRGHPAVVVRLATVSRKDLREVLEQAWWINAPKRLRLAGARRSPGRGEPGRAEVRR